MPAERSRGESRERENNPDQAATAVLGEAASNAEIRSATENTPAPESVEKAKKYLKEGGKFAVNALSVVSQTVLGLTLGLLKFAKEIVVKRGKVGFSKGYEIGSEAVSFDGKKDKKS